MASVEALVTPEVIKWAREQMSLSLEEAARKIGRPVEDVAGWEDGSRRPTIAQLREASRVYKRPLAVFYLPAPPKGFSTLRDFRSLPESSPRQYSPELALLIRTADFRNRWLSEYLENDGVEPLPFVASASLGDPPGRVAADIRETLAITQTDLRHCSGRDEASRLWIRKAEAIGIFVFRLRSVSLAEARGFVISNAYAPMIFINANDAKAGQIFTLAHELAHIWLGHTGISNLETHGRMIDQEASAVETFCNQVAAEVILPPQDFRKSWAVAEGDLDTKIARLAREFKVSELVIARRLFQEGIIARQVYEQIQTDVQKRWQEESRKEKKGGPVDYSVKMAAQNGHMFTKTVIAGFLSGAVSGRDASELLNVKINNFSKLGKAVGLPV